MVKAAADSLLAVCNAESLNLRVNIPSNHEPVSLKGDLAVSDRFCVIEKNDLYNFIASVDHSIAITKRKLINAI